MLLLYITNVQQWQTVILTSLIRRYNNRILFIRIQSMEWNGDIRSASLKWNNTKRIGRWKKTHTHTHTKTIHIHRQTCNYKLPTENHISFVPMSIFLDDCLRLNTLLPMASSAFIYRQSFDSNHIDINACVCLLLLQLLLLLCVCVFLWMKRIFLSVLCVVDYNLSNFFVIHHKDICYMHLKPFTKLYIICSGIFGFNPIRLMGKSWFWLS